MTTLYWAHVFGKRVKPIAIIGPCMDRDDCVKQACEIALQNKSAISIMHGYGNFGPSFDIRWCNQGYKGEGWRDFIFNANKRHKDMCHRLGIPA